LGFEPRPSDSQPDAMTTRTQESLVKPKSEPDFKKNFKPAYFLFIMIYFETTQINIQKDFNPFLGSFRQNFRQVLWKNINAGCQR